MDDPALAAALALAGELKLPVNLHMSDRQAKPYRGKVETPPEDFRYLARTFRATTFIFAHWGGGVLVLETNPTVRQELANVYYDTAASPLIYDDRIWRTALDLVPAGKILFGTDYPLVLYPQTERAPGWQGMLAEMDGAGLTADEKAALLAGNTARLLGL